jgi:hypothetical protein
MMKNSLTILIILCLIAAFTTVSAQENPSDKEKLIVLAWQQFNDGVVFIEKAETMEDFKKAITAFNDAQHFALAAGLYTEMGRTINYNLGLLYDATENYAMASNYLTMYICGTPVPADSAEVKALIDQIDYKAEQFINPETLTGIWYYSIPRESSEPRLEIRANNGIVEARCLTSEAWSDKIPPGEFVRTIWSYSEKKLTITDAVYYDCEKELDPNWCPQKITLNLVRTGENKLEGEMTSTGIIYQDVDNPEIFTSSGNVVFEREE